MTIYDEAITAHKKWRGKIEVTSKAKVHNKDDLSLAYTPGVAEPCRRIAEDKNKAYDYTWKGNSVAVVTDGTAVLGLGEIRRKSFRSSKRLPRLLAASTWRTSVRRAVLRSNVR